MWYSFYCSLLKNRCRKTFRWSTLVCKHGILNSDCIRNAFRSQIHFYRAQTCRAWAHRVGYHDRMWFVQKCVYEYMQVFAKCICDRDSHRIFTHMKLFVIPYLTSLTKSRCNYVLYYPNIYMLHIWIRSTSIICYKWYSCWLLPKWKLQIFAVLARIEFIKFLWDE